METSLSLETQKNVAFVNASMSILLMTIATLAFYFQSVYSALVSAIFLAMILCYMSGKTPLPGFAAKGDYTIILHLFLGIGTVCCFIMVFVFLIDIFFPITGLVDEKMIMVVLIIELLYCLALSIVWWQASFRVVPSEQCLVHSGNFLRMGQRFQLSLLYDKADFVALPSIVQVDFRAQQINFFDCSIKPSRLSLIIEVYYLDPVPEVKDIRERFAEKFLEMAADASLAELATGSMSRISLRLGSTQISWSGEISRFLIK